MAYENYTQVSWSSGTPITGERLQQMSQNIQEVKDATDDKPKGIIKFKSITASFTSNSVGTLPNSSLGILTSLISEPSGPDNRITTDASRYIKIVINFPGFAIQSYGQEDAVYEIALIESTGGGSNTLVATWDFSSGPMLYINTASSATANIYSNAVSNISNLANSKITANSIVSSGTYVGTNIKTQVTNSYYLGAGTYSYVKDTGSGLTNYSYYVLANRKQGANSNNSSTFTVSTLSPLQLYVEDIGGTF